MRQLIIMNSNGVVLKTSYTNFDFIPRTNNIVIIDGRRYQVTSNVFNYDLMNIVVWVTYADDKV